MAFGLYEDEEQESAFLSDWTALKILKKSWIWKGNAPAISPTFGHGLKIQQPIKKWEQMFMQFWKMTPPQWCPVTQWGWGWFLPLWDLDWHLRLKPSDTFWSTIVENKRWTFGELQALGLCSSVIGGDVKVEACILPLLCQIIVLFTTCLYFHLFFCGISSSGMLWLPCWLLVLRCGVSFR